METPNQGLAARVYHQQIAKNPSSSDRRLWSTRDYCASFCHWSLAKIWITVDTYLTTMSRDCFTLYCPSAIRLKTNQQIQMSGAPRKWKTHLHCRAVSDKIRVHWYTRASSVTFKQSMVERAIPHKGTLLEFMKMMQSTYAHAIYRCAL